jgi:hypothetical protein
LRVELGCSAGQGILTWDSGNEEPVLLPRDVVGRHDCGTRPLNDLLGGFRRAATRTPCGADCASGLGRGRKRDLGTRSCCLLSPRALATRALQAQKAAQAIKG